MIEKRSMSIEYRLFLSFFSLFVLLYTFLTVSVFFSKEKKTKKSKQKHLAMVHHICACIYGNIHVWMMSEYTTICKIEREMYCYTDDLLHLYRIYEERICIIIYYRW